MHSFQSLLVLTESLPIDSLLSTTHSCQRGDDADSKARSAIVQILRTQPIVAVGELLERETCSALEMWTKLESTYKKDNM